MKYCIVIFLSIFLISCDKSDKSITQDCSEVMKAYLELKEKKNEQMNRKGKLVHTVYLNVENDLHSETIDSLVTNLYTLADIPEIQNLIAGKFEDIGDERAMKEFDIVMQMEFKSLEDYQKYQVHPLHVQLRESLASKLSAVPTTHDFIIE